jgi:hypothetical protein
MKGLLKIGHSEDGGDEGSGSGLFSMAAGFGITGVNIPYHGMVVFNIEF